jgi:hypothetical protein
VISVVHEKIKDKFGFDAEITQSANLMLLRVHGIDNYSLARWIIHEFDDIKVTVKDKDACGYKISNYGWIKIEENKDRELVLT